MKRQGSAGDSGGRATPSPGQGGGAPEARRLPSGIPVELAPEEEDRRLTRMLRRLPEAPIRPGFTARVLAALGPEGAPRRPFLEDWFAAWTFRPWWPRLAGVGVLLVLAVLWWQPWSAPSTRLAQSLVSVTRPVQETGLATQMPAVEVLMDYEAIDQMRQFAALVDEDLLASLEVAGP